MRLNRIFLTAVLLTGLMGIGLSGCNLGYDPAEVVLVTAEDGATDGQEDLDAVISPDLPEDRAEEEVVQDTTPPEDPVVDAPRDVQEVTDAVEAGDVVDATDLADAEDSVEEEEPDPGPCAVRICSESPAPLVYDENFDTDSVGTTPCAWEGITPPQGSQGPPPVVAGALGAQGRWLQSGVDGLGGLLKFVPQNAPIWLEIDFRVSQTDIIDAIDQLCLLGGDDQTCLVDLRYNYTTRGIYASYVVNQAEPETFSLGRVDPMSWHRFTILARTPEEEEAGNYDLWVDGAHGGTAIPIPIPTEVEVPVFDRLEFRTSAPGTRPPTAVDNLYLAPLSCDEWTGHSICERQRPIVQLLQGAVANRWIATVQGGTTGAEDVHEGSCLSGEASGPDAVVPFRVPVTMVSLMVSTRDSSFDTTLYVRSECADPTSELPDGCNEDFSPATTSEVNLYCVQPGVYYAIVDGDGPDDSGDFQVYINGLQGMCE
ncbi:MAG: hypothetical protein JW797_19495 [Bradymonadales bacterium]|nr:hypothetical protein [Bradymonadales bacterium]